METDLQEINVTAQRLPDDKYVDTRDFRVKAIQLISADGSFRDITHLVMEIQVRQDLYLGFMSGDMLVTDAIDLHTLAALHGNEYLYVHIEEPSQSISINKAFRVYKVSDRITVLNSAARYLIHFTSDELVLSNLKKVSKAYKDSKISDIAQDIMANYLLIGSSKITVDETSQPVDVVIPNWRPAEALNWLASRAFSPDNTCWFFYENLEGFNFRSLQSLYKEPNPIKVPFVFENKGFAKSLDMDKYAIDSFIALKDFDILESSSQGGFGMRLMGLDPFHRTFITTDYSLSEVPKLFKNEAFANPVIDSTPLYDSGDSHYMTYLDSSSTSTEKESGTKNWLKRIQSLAALNSNLSEVVVPGNIRIQAGSLVSIRYPYTVTPKEGVDMWDKRKSGKYLVVAVNHKFELVNHRFQTIFMTARDSMPESLPPPDITVNDKIRKINNA